MSSNKEILDRLIRIEDKLDDNSLNIREFKTLLQSHMNNKWIHFSKSELKESINGMSIQSGLGKKEYGLMALFATVITGLFEIIRGLLH